jgi:alkylation response protein AidB-like acyl-CoA dehydrogenase
MTSRITRPTDTALRVLSERLSALAPTLDGAEDAWPARQLELCGCHGVFEWFVSQRWGGQQWSEVDVVRGYLALSAACLTTTFVITQRSGACRRIEVSQNDWIRDAYLPELAAGRCFATVGISHLTTSRRHLAEPVLRARETAEGFVLDGYSPWVTGARYAELIVTGGTLADGREVLVALPRDLPGVTTPPCARLVGLSASCTGPVELKQVLVERRWLLAGPVENVMQQGEGANTGGLQTTTLALGLAGAAIDYLEREANVRSDLEAPGAFLRSEWQGLTDGLLRAAEGDPTQGADVLRARANSLVVRASQAALAAAKGSGYVVGHPAARWCREALFFLVWSCPQPVLAANLCELAQMET